MGSSPYGKLSFGVAFEEDFEFPWSDREKYEDGIRSWWLEVTGYVQPSELHCSESIYDSKRKWLELNPIPVGLVARGSYDELSYILATLTVAVEWNETLSINPSLFDNVEKDTKIITEFLNKYQIQYEGKPSWLLSSFYG